MYLTLLCKADKQDIKNKAELICAAPLQLWWVVGAVTVTDKKLDLIFALSLFSTLKKKLEPILK